MPNGNGVKEDSRQTVESLEHHTYCHHPWNFIPWSQNGPNVNNPKPLTAHLLSEFGFD